MSYSKLVYTVASIDTQCIDSNLESGRYVSRVRASKFLSLGTYGKLFMCSYCGRLRCGRIKSYVLLP